VNLYIYFIAIVTTVTRVFAER